MGSNKKSKKKRQSSKKRRIKDPNPSVSHYNPFMPFEYNIGPMPRIRDEYPDLATRIKHIYDTINKIQEKRYLPLMIDKLLEEIKRFKPPRSNLSEWEYQLSLHSWLKQKFPDADIEKQRGSSRPDIVIGDNIAIELKGPTTRRGLITIADKINRYSLHFEYIIVVLFDLQVNTSEEFYKEWYNGITSKYSNVIIINK